MDKEADEEIESIWEREKKYIDVKKIRGVSREQIQQGIKKQLESVSTRGKNPQANSEFLIKKGFPERASENRKIREELLSDNIKEIKVRGKTRFQIAKGTPTTKIDGKTVRAGQFISGKTKEQATKNLIKKVD